MTRFSANLGFLWNELSLPQAILAAKASKFDAVECHWPFDTPVADVTGALEEAGFEMLCLNTRRGNTAIGEYGLSALPGRVGEAREAIDEAIEYGAAIGAKNVHMMAGIAAGEAAFKTYTDNLEYACGQAARRNITILIEPLNRIDVPGYFLTTVAQAAAIIGKLDLANLQLMFDCYHVQINEGNLTRNLKEMLPLIGHIQFASVPDRGPPVSGEIDHAYLFRFIAELGYTKPLGAEYRPVGATEETLSWLSGNRC